MNPIRKRLALATLILAGLAGAPGCGRDEEPTVPTGPVHFTEEQVQAIRSQDQLVNDEEGTTRVTRPAGSKKVR